MGRLIERLCRCAAVQVQEPDDCPTLNWLHDATLLNRLQQSYKYEFRAENCHFIY